ncbi:NUDIX hydrolase [Aliiroseovarius sp. 2305UL8-7]|uniref:NUDIX hydrolase n=1 Tax=Aliiroseovarius conchicola TaxID=3121637 RepID=UPI003528B117
MTGRPKLAALAVVVRDGRVLLVKRRNQPEAGSWGFPGGHVDFGETTMQAAVRELREETSVLGRPVCHLTNVEMIDRDHEGFIRFHFLLAAVKCDYLSGKPIAQDDVSAARWWVVSDVINGKVECSKHVDLVTSIASG